MVPNKYQTAVWFIFILVMVSLSLLVARPPLPIQAGPTLPPRYIPTATPRPDDDEDDGPDGAYIELHLQDTPPTAWTVVQWQDSAGGWHDVEGWRGTLDEGNEKIWWVAQADFGKGPFRWAVYQGPGDDVLAMSEPFHLPDFADERVRIELSVAP